MRKCCKENHEAWRFSVPRGLLPASSFSATTLLSSHLHRTAGLEWGNPQYRTTLHPELPHSAWCSKGTSRISTRSPCNADCRNEEVPVCITSRNHRQPRVRSEECGCQYMSTNNVQCTGSQEAGCLLRTFIQSAPQDRGSGA